MNERARTLFRGCFNDHMAAVSRVSNHHAAKCTRLGFTVTWRFFIKDLLFSGVQPGSLALFRGTTRTISAVQEPGLTWMGMHCSPCNGLWKHREREREKEPSAELPQEPGRVMKNWELNWPSVSSIHHLYHVLAACFDESPVGAGAACSHSDNEKCPPRVLGSCVSYMPACSGGRITVRE